jgi:hypothetical protein
VYFPVCLPMIGLAEVVWIEGKKVTVGQTLEAAQRSLRKLLDEWQKLLIVHEALVRRAEDDGGAHVQD